MRTMLNYSWLHVLPLWGHFNGGTAGFECSRNSRSFPGEFDNVGNAETCPLEGQGHLAHGTASGFPLWVMKKLIFVYDTQMSFRQSIIVRGNESSDDSSVLHLAPGWERRVALIWHFRL